MFFYNFYHLYRTFTDGVNVTTMKVRGAFSVTPKMYYYNKG